MSIYDSDDLDFSSRRRLAKPPAMLKIGTVAPMATRLLNVKNYAVFVSEGHPEGGLVRAYTGRCNCGAEEEDAGEPHDSGCGWIVWDRFVQQSDSEIRAAELNKMVTDSVLARRHDLACSVAVLPTARGQWGVARISDAALERALNGIATVDLLSQGQSYADAMNAASDLVVNGWNP